MSVFVNRRVIGIDDLPLDLKYRIMECLHSLNDFSNLLKTSAIFSAAASYYHSTLESQIRENEKFYRIKQERFEKVEKLRVPIRTAILLRNLKAGLKQIRIVSVHEFSEFTHRLSEDYNENNQDILLLTSEQLQELICNHEVVTSLSDLFCTSWLKCSPLSCIRLHDGNVRSISRDESEWFDTVNCFYKIWIMVTLMKICGKIWYHKENDTFDFERSLQVASKCMRHLIRNVYELEEIKIVLGFFLKYMENYYLQIPRVDMDISREIKKWHQTVCISLFHADLSQFQYLFTTPREPGPTSSEHLPEEFKMVFRDWNNYYQCAQNQKFSPTDFKLTFVDHLWQMLNIVDFGPQAPSGRNTRGSVTPLVRRLINR